MTRNSVTGRPLALAQAFAKYFGSYAALEGGSISVVFKVIGGDLVEDYMSYQEPTGMVRLPRRKPTPALAVAAPPLCRVLPINPCAVRGAHPGRTAMRLTYNKCLTDSLFFGRTQV